MIDINGGARRTNTIVVRSSNCECSLLLFLSLFHVVNVLIRSVKGSSESILPERRSEANYGQLAL